MHAEAHKAMKEFLGRQLTEKEAAILDHRLTVLGAESGSIGRVIAYLEFLYGNINDIYNKLNRLPVQLKDAITEGANDAHYSIKEDINREIEYAQNAAQLSIERTAVVTQKTLADSVKKNSLELANAAAKTERIRSLGRWICWTVLTVCLGIGGLFWAIYSSSFNAGYEKGVAKTHNTEILLAERDIFWNTDLGKRLELLAKNGTLDENRLDFIESAPGNRAYDLFKNKTLQKRLSFPETKIGSLVMAYINESPDTLTQILQCKTEGWEIKQSKGRDFCFPVSNAGKKPSGYFLLPK